MSPVGFSKSPEAFKPPIEPLPIKFAHAGDTLGTVENIRAANSLLVADLCFADDPHAREIHRQLDSGELTCVSPGAVSFEREFDAAFENYSATEWTLTEVSVVRHGEMRTCKTLAAHGGLRAANEADERYMIEQLLRLNLARQNCDCTVYVDRQSLIYRIQPASADCLPATGHISDPMFADELVERYGDGGDTAFVPMNGDMPVDQRIQLIRGFSTKTIPSCLQRSTSDD